MCGPYEANAPSGCVPAARECPECLMTPGEHAYRDRIMRLGGAEVYRQEFREAHGLPAT